MDSRSPIRCCSYSRVSTVKQTLDGASIAIQQDHIRRYADLYSLEIAAEEVDDGYSGKDLKRPAIRRTLAGLEGGVYDGIIIYDLSRLSRSVRDIVALIEGPFSQAGGKHLFSSTESISTTSAAGVLFLMMSTAFNQYFRMQVSEKVQDSVDRRRGNGERTTNVAPYGWQLAGDGKTLVENPTEQQGLSLARALKDDGQSYRSICSALDSQGFPSRSGRPWSVTALRRIMNRNL